jgi:nucleoid-associated protein YgaU
MFFPGSRYRDVATDSIVNAEGRVVRFLKTRFIPPTPARAAVVVNGGERLDHIAQRVYQDPEVFWRICDANDALWPPDLVAEPGQLLRVPPAEG